MKPQLQKHRFNDGSGVVGDCHRTCIAMMLNMDRDDVPHFMADVPYHTDAQHPLQVAAAQAEQAWLAQFGLTALSLPYSGEAPLEQLLDQIRMTGNGAPVLLGCTSGNGVNHSVVVWEGQIYNPNGDGGIIAGPMADGYWWLTIYSVGPNYVARSQPVFTHEHLVQGSAPR